MFLRLTDPSTPFEVTVALHNGEKVELGRFRTSAEAEDFGARLTRVSADDTSAVLHELIDWVNARDDEETLHRPDENIHKKSIRCGWEQIRTELHRRIEALGIDWNAAGGKEGGK
ncbi:MAG: hypothetical protein WC563_15120 [Brevundimonas sp.]